LAARRLAASITGSRRKVKTAGYSIARCVGLPPERIEIAFAVGATPIPFRLFSAQPFNFTLLPLQLGDQIITRSGASARSQALVGTSRPAKSIP
jgi:hypothetical protein